MKKATNTESRSIMIAVQEQDMNENGYHHGRYRCYMPDGTLIRAEFDGTSDKYKAEPICKTIIIFFYLRNCIACLVIDNFCKT